MKTIFALCFVLLAYVPAQAEEPVVYYCEMRKKVAIDQDGRVKEYDLVRFKFKDYRIAKHGKGLIEIGSGLGFPNRLDNINLDANTYYDEDFFKGFDEYHGLLWSFKNGSLYLSTRTSEGLLSIVSNCEKF
jgi:hypothetical protein